MTLQFLTRRWLPAAVLLILLFACNNNTSTAKDANTDSTANNQPAKTEIPQKPGGPTVPFNALIIKHTVADYAKWKPFFDADSTIRNEAGLHVIDISRGIDNPSVVNLPNLVDDIAKAKAFASDPRLKDVMQKAGVVSAPELKFIQVLRMSEAAQKHGDYIELSLKVKDFDKWLKVFDSEGPASRAADGLTDGVLGRGIDDPNQVYLVFVITDTAKAKAAITNNPARKKLMVESGVVGQPEIFLGRDQQ